jgi:hypothetical protein
MLLDLTSLILNNQVQGFQEFWKLIPGFPGGHTGLVFLGECKVDG